MLGAEAQRVILSQIWRGIAAVSGKETISGADLAVAFQSASRTAYEGLEKPVEGTMLTVMKEMAAAAIDSDYLNIGISGVLRTAVEAANKAVANTPNLLPVLKEAGVVDSGGQGLYILFEGALMYLSGRTAELEYGKSRIITAGNGIGESPRLADIKEEIPYGYCTEFI